MGKEVEIELRPINELSSKLTPLLATSNESIESTSLEKGQGTGPFAKQSNHLIILPPQQQTQSTKLRKVVGVVSFYIITSISMVMINKMVLRQSGLPLTFLWGQLVVAAIFLRLLAALQLITLPSASLSLFRSTLPLITINVLGLVLNTLCLQHIDAVLYQVARSLILPITISLSPFMGQRISRPTLICCLVISIGFVVGIFGEGIMLKRLATVQISTIGVVFGVLSSFTTAIHSFVIKKSFTNVKQEGHFDLLYLNNLFSALLLAPFLFLEVGDLVMLSRRGWSPIQSFGLGTLLAGIAGLLINWAGFLQINVTSPITHTVSSAARGVLQTIVAHWILAEAITITRCIGIAVTLAGSCAYSLVKAREAQYKAVTITTPTYNKLPETTLEPKGLRT